jgi:hypothetical protein
MRENRPSGSEGGATLIPSSLPLSIVKSLRDKKPTQRLRSSAKLALTVPPTRRHAIETLQNRVYHFTSAAWFES